MDFKFQNSVNKDKLFIVNRNKLEKRLDPFYYIPSLMELEEKVQEQEPQPLRHFVNTIASGATPKTSEYEKYYSDKENGIPFLRVQNLSPTGVLDTEKVKYINETTHENYLKRSQVEEGDLLVKITGVGRMAVASVAPDGFVGNTNQHMVVIKTGSKETSEILAAYLNTDIAEALASRRATGGTRPALDYPALLSIPIIHSEQILRINRKAIESKQEKEKEAQELLNSIDDYLFEELGIDILQKENSLVNRIFTTSLSEIAGSRMDASSVSTKYLNYAVLNSKYGSIKLKRVVTSISTGTTPNRKLNPYAESGIIFLRNTNLQNGKLDLSKVKFIKNELAKHLTYSTKGDVIICIAGTVGESAINTKDSLAINQNITSLTIKSNMMEPEFLNYYFNSSLSVQLVKRECSIATILYINNNNLLNLNIPFPPKEKQVDIVQHINDIQNKASSLKLEAMQELNKAQKEIQQIILGKIN